MSGSAQPRRALEHASPGTSRQCRVAMFQALGEREARPSAVGLEVRGVALIFLMVLLWLVWRWLKVVYWAS